MKEERKQKVAIVTGATACLLAAGSTAILAAGLLIDEWVKFCGPALCPEVCGTIGFDKLSFPACASLNATQVESIYDFWPVFPAENNFGGFFDDWYTGDYRPKDCADLTGLEANPFFHTYTISKVIVEDVFTADSMFREFSKDAANYTVGKFVELDTALAEFWSTRILSAGTDLMKDLSRAVDSISLLFQALKAASEGSNSGFSLTKWGFNETELNATETVQVEDADSAKAYFGDLDIALANVASLLQAFASQEESQRVLATLAPSESIRLATQIAGELPSLVDTCGATSSSMTTKGIFADVLVVTNTQNLVLTPSLKCLSGVLGSSFANLAASSAVLGLCEGSPIQACRENASRLPENLNEPSKLCKLATLQPEFVGNNTFGVDSQRCSGVDLVTFILNLAGTGKAKTAIPLLPRGLSRNVQGFDLLRSSSFTLRPPHFLHLLTCAEKGLPYTPTLVANSCQAAFANPALLEKADMSEAEARAVQEQAEYLPETVSSPIALCQPYLFLGFLVCEESETFTWGVQTSCSDLKSLNQVQSTFSKQFQVARNGSSWTDQERRLFSPPLYSRYYSEIFPEFCTGRSDCLAKVNSLDPKIITYLASGMARVDPFPEGRDLFSPFDFCILPSEVERYFTGREFFTPPLVLLSSSIVLIIGPLCKPKWWPVLLVATGLLIGAGILINGALDDLFLNLRRTFPRMGIDKSESFDLASKSAPLAFAAAPLALLVALMLKPSRPHGEVLVSRKDSL